MYVLVRQFFIVQTVIAKSPYETPGSPIAFCIGMMMQASEIVW